MSTFFSSVNELSQIPDRHLQYAQSLLSVFISNILLLDEIDVGVSHGQDAVRSIITFTSDDFEKVLVHLIYSPRDNFRIEVVDNSNEFEDSKFYYTIHEDSMLEKMIPEGLRNIMEEVALEGEEKMIKPKTLT